MDSMFYDCSRLKEIKITPSKFDTSEVVYMQFMFGGCMELTSFDFSGFDTSKVDYMDGMFQSCIGFKELNLTKFSSSNLASMVYMFSGCTQLTKITFSDNFNVIVTEYMSGLFYGCSQLKSLDLSYISSQIRQIALIPSLKAVLI